MLLDLLSPNNQKNFNIKLAKKIGLHASIYIAELLDITDKAIRKNVIHDGFITVLRPYIEDQTTLSAKEQYEIDDNLVKSKILLVDATNKDCIKLDMDVLCAVCDFDTNTSKELAKQMKVKSKKTKQEYNVDALMNHIKCKNGELRTAYFNWLTAVVTAHGLQTTAMVESTERRIDEYSQMDLDVALWVLDKAMRSQWKDVDWAIEAHRKLTNPIRYGNIKGSNQPQQTVKKNTATTQLSTEGF